MRRLLLLAALLAAAPARPTEAIALSVEALAQASDAVVRGEVRSKVATLSGDGRRVFTLVDVEVTAAWRGAPARTVRVIVPGGVAGGLGQRVLGAPAFEPGEQVVLFLAGAEAGSHRVTGLAQGKFSVAGEVARPDTSQLTFLARRVAPGERAAEAMGVAELEARVRSVP